MKYLSMEGIDRMKYVSAIFAALVLAGVTALGASVWDPDPVEAASGGNARKCGGGTISLNANELRSFQLHNQSRKQNGVRQLCVHPSLQKAARAHSKDMIQRGYFSHDTKGSGRDPGQRLKAAGYDWRTYGENIGYDSSPDRMHNAWMNSSGHRKNILNGSFKEVGIGAVTGNYNGGRTTMYTADFGSR